jgi:hypothetical protein
MTRSPKPEARVRRVFDAQPLATPPARLLVRPFMEVFDRGRGLPALLFEGQVRGDEFRISITSTEPIVLVGSAGRDAHGAFVWLAPEERPVGPYHALRVEADAQDVDAWHAAISYFELTGDQVARRELAYADSWYSVYFNPLGLVDGTSSGGPRSIAPGGRPS